MASNVNPGLRFGAQQGLLKDLQGGRGTPQNKVGRVHVGHEQGLRREEMFWHATGSVETQALLRGQGGRHGQATWGACIQGTTAPKKVFLQR